MYKKQDQEMSNSLTEKLLTIEKLFCYNLIGVSTKTLLTTNYKLILRTQP